MARVKIVGDNGGGSFKLSFQIANTSNPNAICNTIPFLVFDAPDTVENLTMTLKPYCAQVKQLEKSRWEGKSIRCIFFGDYEFICSCFVLSGSSGRRPCLFCLVTKKDMQYAPAQQPTCETWSLDTLVANLWAFQAHGSQLSRAKDHNNVIRPALLPILLDWVCIPALHLDLGIYAWMFDAFLCDVRSLDSDLAAQLGAAGVAGKDFAAFNEAAALCSSLSENTHIQQQLQAQCDLIQSQVCTNRTALFIIIVELKWWGKTCIFTGRHSVNIIHVLCLQKRIRNDFFSFLETKFSLRGSD